MATMRVLPAAVPVGAELRGVDLSEGLVEEHARTLREAVSRYGVVFLRDQRITRRRQVDLSRSLGPLRPPTPESTLQAPGYPDLMRMSNIRVDGRLIGYFEAGHCWHTDQCYRERPNAYAVMCAVEVPHDTRGEPLGATMFVNMSHAYETLPTEVKARLRGLSAYHNMQNRFWGDRRSETKRSEQTTHYAVMEGAVHPVLRAHPVTGATCLYVNERYTEHIVGLTEQESRDLLQRLFEHSTRESVRYVHRWSAGDILIWDDCLVLHHAVPDYGPEHRRLMERTVVMGDTPTAASS